MAALASTIVEGLGRYGMGLPNSSLSQAKRVTVHTWSSKHGQVLTSYLDLEEIAAGELTEVPKPIWVNRPEFVNGYASGTAVTWSRCDRLDNKRISTITRKLLRALGRQFRHSLWGGVSIKVNGDAVQPIDPALPPPRRALQWRDSVRRGTGLRGGRQTRRPQHDRYRQGAVLGTPSRRVVKTQQRRERTRGIAKCAGVSVVRAGREVDYGWFFFREKRRENYDDWWRCEIRFTPILDEAFGITHTKQQIRPRPHLIEALSPDLEATARALNSRARKAHLNAKNGGTVHQV